MKIPLVNLSGQYQRLKGEINPAIQEVLESTAFAGGPFVEAFEKDFASFCQTRHAVGLGSGTEALWLALLALGVGPGDEVITTPSTFIATAEAITFAGATPVFVDIEESTFNINPALIESAITPRTKAIIPVHLFGQTADMDPILEIARRHGLPVIEDACQAHGAEYKGRQAGSMGDIGCFSFYPGKNLGAYGEAGAAVTNRDDLNSALRILRDHGQTRKYTHSVIGWNARMDGIQGAVLRVKLKYLAKGNAARRAHARLYSELLAGLDDLLLPRESEDRLHVFHIYAVRVSGRDDLAQALARRGIASAVHYPTPLHLQNAYRFLERPRGSFPVAERCAEEFLSLPMFPELTPDEIRTVAGEVTQWVDHAKIAYARVS